MKQRMVEKLINECAALYDSIPMEELNVWNYFVSVNNIVSDYEGLECLMNLNFSNGGITNGICVITDWEPGALVFQSDDGSIPKMRVVFPEEYEDFMGALEPIFTAEYPSISEDQDC